MDLVEVLSNLHALRQLYELLQNIEDGLQHINAKNVHQNLDVRARKLLKDLLDEATEKMFNTQLKVIEAQSAVHQTPYSSQLEQPKAMPKLRYSLSLDSVKSSLNSVLNNEKDSKSSKSTSEKDEQYPMKRQAAILESKVNTSPDLPQYKKKRCHVCIAKDMKKQYSTKEATMFNERAEVPGKNSRDQDQQRDWGSDRVSCVDENAKRLQESNSKTIGKENPIGTIGETLSSSVSLTTGATKQIGDSPISQMKNKSDEGSDFAEVVANAIEQIESCILALQISSNLAHSSVNNDVDEHVPVSPVEHTKEEAITRRETNQTHMAESLLGGGTQLLTCRASQLSQKHGEFVESVSRGQDSPLVNNMKRFQSLSRSVSQNNNKMASYVNRLRVPASPNEVAMKPPLQVKIPATPVQSSQTSLVQNRTARKGTSRSNSSMRPQSMQSMASSVGVGLGTKLSKSRTRVKSEKRHDQIMMRPVLLDDYKPSQRTRTHKMSDISSRKKIMPRQPVLEEETSSSSSRSSSTWTSKQNDSSASSCSNESEESCSPRNDDFSESESNSQESISSSFSSEEEEEDRRSRLTHKIYPEKSIGRLRRIKNRLGLIFHHHHHHHHHHHGNDRSAWTKVQKMFHHKNKHGTNDHGHGEGVKKSLAVKNMNKKQGGHFHALVEGLMRHVKHSNKSKGGIRRPHQSHGLSKKKVVNKLHWWQMLQRGGVKLPKRGGVKVGFANKRPKLKMKR